MTRSTSGITLTGIAALVGFAALVAACAQAPRTHIPPPPSVSAISIQVSGCATEHVAIVVHPWVAHVPRNGALRWNTPAGVDSVAIQATFPDRWPSEWAAPGQRQRRSAAGGAAIQAGAMRPGVDAGPYSYRFLLYCDGRVIDIDPEVVIFDP